MTRWYFEPILESYAVVLGIALVLTLLLVVGPSYTNVSRRRSAALIGLRLATILLVVLAMLRPTCVSSTTHQQSASILVLVDSSRSMQVPDMPDGKTRWQAQRELLNKAAPILATFPDTFDVKLYTYDESLHDLPLADGVLRLPTDAAGSATDIGTALDEAVRKEAGKRIAAIVIIGDGAQRAYNPKVELHQAARELARQGIPLYAIPFGQSVDSTTARDVAVENLPDSYTVFVKNELVIRPQLRIRGYVNQPIDVELIVEDSFGNVSVAAGRQITANEPQQRPELNFVYTPEEPGQYRLTVKAQTQPGEMVTANNQMSAFLTVLDGGLKVLYLEGHMIDRQEQRFLQRTFLESADIQLDFKWFDQRLRDSWPVDLEADLDLEKYDVFILGDLDATALGDANLKKLAFLIENGKGLVALGGSHSFGAGGYGPSAFAKVFPMRMSINSRQPFDKPIETILHRAGPLVMIPKGEHYVTHLSNTDNEAAWRSLPPLDGANRFGRVKNQAIVIAATPTGTPLLVAHQYGLGRVLAMAGDSTWRWWTHGHKDAHKRFWRQVVLWLAQKEELTRRDVWIDLAQRRYPLKFPISFTMGARDESGDPIAGLTYEAAVVLPSGSRETVRISSTAEGAQGDFEHTALVGQYTLEVIARRAEAEVGRAKAPFLVVDRDIELDSPAANPEQLQTMAELTTGKRIAPPELVPLLERLADSPPELQLEVQTRWQLADGPIDAWLTLLLFATFLGTEWYLRKKWGLV